MSVGCGLSSRGLIGTFLYNTTVTGAPYLLVLQCNIVQSISIVFLKEEFFIQQDGVQSHYLNDMSNFLNDNFSGS